jgi:hypothetical protein
MQASLVNAVTTHGMSKLLMVNRKNLNRMFIIVLLIDLDRRGKAKTVYKILKIDKLNWRLK